MRQTANRWGATVTASDVDKENFTTSDERKANQPAGVQIGPDALTTSDVGNHPSPQVRAVIAALAAGAKSWAATGRQAGVSRQTARNIALRYGACLPPSAGMRVPGGREATLSIRVRGGAMARLDAYAAALGVSRSEAGRRLLAAALASTDQPASPIVTDVYGSGYDDARTATRDE